MNKERISARKKATPALTASVKRLIHAGKKKAFPRKAAPMLATLVEDVPPGDYWLYEIKWDGYRCMALLKNNVINLRSRNDKSFNEKYYPVFNALGALSIDAVLDGEIAVVADNG